jgi:hypothetical protein
MGPDRAAALIITSSPKLKARPAAVLSEISSAREKKGGGIPIEERHLVTCEKKRIGAEPSRPLFWRHFSSLPMIRTMKVALPFSSVSLSGPAIQRPSLGLSPIS